MLESVHSDWSLCGSILIALLWFDRERITLVFYYLLRVYISLIFCVIWVCSDWLSRRRDEFDGSLPAGRLCHYFGLSSKPAGAYTWTQQRYIFSTGIDIAVFSTTILHLVDYLLRGIQLYSAKLFSTQRLLDSFAKIHRCKRFAHNFAHITRSH